MGKLPVQMKFAVLFLLVSFAAMSIEALYLVNLNSKPSMAMMHHHVGPLIVGAAGHDHADGDAHAHAEEDAGHDDHGTAEEHAHGVDDAHDGAHAHDEGDEHAGMHGHGEEAAQEPAEER